MSTDKGPSRKAGADLIAAERQRQIDAEGWTPEHDSEHTGDPAPLVQAAHCYLSSPSFRTEGRPPFAWPWDARFWKPTPDDRVRELVKAGALIAAEIDRLQASGKAGYPNV